MILIDREKCKKLEMPNKSSFRQYLPTSMTVTVTRCPKSFPDDTNKMVVDFNTIKTEGLLDTCRGTMIVRISAIETDVGYKTVHFDEKFRPYINVGIADLVQEAKNKGVW